MRATVLLALAVAPVVCRADDRELAREIAIGKSAASYVERNYRLLPDEQAQSEIIRIGQKIASQLSRREHPFVFKIVVGESAPPLNEPWSFPGGFIYVPSALILGARSEAQVAGMLAHAITHVADGHMALANKKAGLARQTIWGPQSAHTTVMAGWWREFELLADAGAAKLMARAGYDPAELADYLERGGADAERVAKLIKASADALPVGAVVPGLEFANLQAAVRMFSGVPDTPKFAPSLRYSGRR